MSPTPIRRRRASRAVACAALCLTLLAGCATHQRDATSYKGTKDNFIAGCVTTAKKDNGAGTGTKISSPSTYCQCVFSAISDKKTGMKFDDFAKINSDLRDNGGALPKKLTKYFDSCLPGAS